MTENWIPPQGHPTPPSDPHQPAASSAAPPTEAPSQAWPWPDPRSEPTAPPEPAAHAPRGDDARQRHGGFLRRTSVLALVALLSGGSGAAVATLLDDDGLSGPVSSTSAGDAEVRSIALSGETLDVAGVIDVVGPAVVSIQTAVGGPMGARGGGAGTGVIISADGEVMTNAHVVDGASGINVRLAGESQSRQATLVGSDPANDLALLRIDDAENLPVADLGSSGALAVGDDVVAIGNALALRGGPTVTTGIVSGLDRTLPTENGTMTGLLQTDASISSGNSGGPLVNAAGEVVAINTAVAASGGGRSAENIGFSIPIDKAGPVIDRLRSGADPAEPGYLGIGIADPDDGSRGGVVTSVEPGSPAEEAGVRTGDLVTEVEGSLVDGAASLAGAIQGNAPGDEVTIGIVRDGEEESVEVVLGARATS